MVEKCPFCGSKSIIAVSFVGDSAAKLRGKLSDAQIEYGGLGCKDCSGIWTQPPDRTLGFVQCIFGGLMVILPVPATAFAIRHLGDSHLPGVAISVVSLAISVVCLLILFQGMRVLGYARATFRESKKSGLIVIKEGNVAENGSEQ